MAVGRRHWWLALALLATLVLTACGWKWLESRRYRHVMAEIKAEMADGRHAIAARNLTYLLASGP